MLAGLKLFTVLSTVGSVRPEVTWTHPALPSILSLIPVDVESLLDLGCGRGIVGALCRIYRAPRRLVGLDAWEPYLSFCREHRLYDELVRWDLNDLPLPFGDKEFDVVTAIEVIEHLPRAAGLRLLREAERVARRRVVVTTPQVFFEQEAYDGNPYQAHRSLWTWRDFARLGYRVYGAGSFLFSGRKVRWLSEYLSPLRSQAVSQLCRAHHSG